MTFDSRFCEDVFDTLGRYDLRHAYRVYLWRRALGLVHRTPSDIEVVAGAEFHSEALALSWSKRTSELDAERALRM
jgi:hypothetical protein